MEEWLKIVTEQSVVLVDAMALIVILVGTVEAFLNALRAMLRKGDVLANREVWLRYGRWLVAGLTFQLAADIIETSIAPNWDDIGRLAAIAAVRTFLNFFLDRDMAEIGEQDRRAVEENET